MPNTELVRATMDRVLGAAPLGGWIQRRWLSEPQGEWCGTAGCYAGHCVMLLGYTEEERRSVPCFCGLDHEGDIQLRNPATGDVVTGKDVSTVACRALGLTEGDAGRLFSADNTLEDLKHMVDVLCDGGHL